MCSEDDTATVFDKGTAVNDQKSKKRKENFVTKVLVILSGIRIFLAVINYIRYIIIIVLQVPIVTLGGHRDAVVGVKWATWSNKQIVTSSWDHSIAVWDLELGLIVFLMNTVLIGFVGGEVNRIRSQKAFSSIDVQRNGGLVISSSTDNIPRLFDVRSHGASIVSFVFKI